MSFDSSIRAFRDPGIIMTLLQRARSITAIGMLLLLCAGALRAATVEDATPPVFSGVVRDGTLAWDDLKLSFSTGTLTANWDEAEDPESGIGSYYYAIGTTPGGTDFAGWTLNGTSVRMADADRCPERDVVYYVSVYAVNGSGEKSRIITSDGQSVEALLWQNGIKVPDENERRFIAERTIDVTAVTPNAVSSKRARAAGAVRGIPPRAKNYSCLPSVGSQGGQGSCAAFAVCYYLKTFQESKEHGWGRSDPRSHPERVFSPAFGYNLCNNGYDNGSWPQSIMARMVEHGCATLKDMPYDWRDHTAWPSETAWRNAIPYRALSVGSIDISSLEGIKSLKQLLANGETAVISLEAYENFVRYPVDGAGISNGVLYATSGRKLFGHAMAVIGYDDDKTYFDGISVRKGAFLAVNSWGENWGVSDADAGSRGFIWISYEYLRTRTGFTQASFMTDRQGYDSTAFGTFSFIHPQKYTLSARFLHGDSPENPDAAIGCTEWYSPGNNSSVAGNQTIVVDLSGFPADSRSYFLEVYDDDSGNDSSGLITAASVEIDGRIWASTSVPCATVNGRYTRVAIPMSGGAASLTAEIRVSCPGQYQDTAGAGYQSSGLAAQDTPCLGAGTFDVFLTLSEAPGAKPSLSYRLAGGTAADIPLEGSGTAWRGRFFIDPSREEGEGHFILNAVNSAGIGGAAIIRGSMFYVRAVPAGQYNGVAEAICYPNPARMSRGDIVKIGHIAAGSGEVVVRVYNVAGELVRTLSEGGGITENAGEKIAAWDGRNENGERAASGIYLCRVTGEGRDKTIKAALIW